MPDSTDLLMERFAPAGHATRLEVRSIVGDFVRTVTAPPPGFADHSAAVARDIGMIFFVRSALKWSGEQSSGLEDHVVMRVPLDGSEPPEIVPTDREFRTVSVSDDGRLLAGECDAANGYSQVCLMGPTAGGVRMVLGRRTPTWLTSRCRRMAP